MDGKYVRWVIIGASFAFSGISNADDSKTGVVCIDRINTDGSWEGNDTGATRRSSFRIRIDSASPIVVSSGAGGKLPGLSLDLVHVVRIDVDGKPLTSFKFSFREYESHQLRLWYNGMYGTWSLWPMDAGSRCQVDGRKK